VDTEGFVLKVKVHSANVPDQDAIRLLLEESARDRLLRRLTLTYGSTPVTKDGARSGPKTYSA